MFWYTQDNKNVGIKKIIIFENKLIAFDFQDDEYRWAGVEDPKVMLTTSRDPSAPLKKFVKVGLLIYWSIIDGTSKFTKLFSNDNPVYEAFALGN